MPAPNLDDRRFQDLVDDGRRYVQRRCPEWSDHNISDPGITLIETFAMVADQLLYRLNRVPDRLYLRFLELLGIELVPPTPARADTTFWLAAPRPTDVTVRAGTEVATARAETVDAEAGAAVAFETVEELTIVACSLAAVATAAARTDPVDRTEQLADGTAVACFSDQPRVDDTILFGLSAAVPRCAIALRVDCRAAGAGVVPTNPPWLWEAWTGRDWERCAIEPGREGTGGFNRPGDVVLHVPAGHAVRSVAGRQAGWLRCRLVAPTAGQPFYQRSPSLLTAEAFTIGGTIGVVHAETVHDEVLGLSEGVPGQRFRLSRGPVLGGPDEPLVVEVSGPDGFVAWQRVEHFDASRPTDRHFRLDVTTGEIVFGPGVRQLDGTLRQLGAVPDRAAPVRATVYRVGGGTRGNVADGKIVAMRTSVPFVTSVRNSRPATGGVDGEDVAAARRRAPAFLRTRQRAVTTTDFEYLATAADPRVARARCIAGQGAEAAVIRLAIVPASSGDPAQPADLSTFLPDPPLLQRVSDELDARRVLGTRLIVEPPFYQWISADVRLRRGPTADADRVRTDALAVLYRFLHPLAGGPDGEGWPFGRTVVAGELLALVARVSGVDLVEEVRLYRADTRGARQEGWTTRVDLGRGALPFGVNHRVEVTG